MQPYPLKLYISFIIMLLFLLPVLVRLFQVLLLLLLLLLQRPYRILQWPGEFLPLFLPVPALAQVQVQVPLQPVQLLF